MATPNYKKIYEDVIELKHPSKNEICQSILRKKRLTASDIIELNNLIFESDNNAIRENQKYRSYDKSTIFKMLDFQKQRRFTNTQLAEHFNLSRNTITKWKRIYL